MHENYKDYIDREKKKREDKIVHSSFIAILGSLILSIFEIVTGIVSNSSILVLYGIETVSTGIASMVIVVGIKLSSKEPDKKHPLGYGRFEYVADLVVATIIVYIGITALISQIKAIVAGPPLPNYTQEAYVVLVIAMVTKFLFGLHENQVGIKTRSKALIGTAIDSYANALFSFTIILSAIIYERLGIDVENYIGLLISAMIIRNGFGIFMNTLTEILGRRANPLFVKEIKDAIMEFEPVEGVYDCVLHSYGRDRYVGSVHIEIPSSMPILELENLQRRISEKIYSKFGVMLTAVGIYAINYEDYDFMRIYNYLNTIAKHYRDVEEVHGLFFDRENKRISFDIVLDCSVEHKDLMIQAFKAELEEEYRDYTVTIHRDIPL